MRPCVSSAGKAVGRKQRAERRSGRAERRGCSYPGSSGAGPISLSSLGKGPASRQPEGVTAMFTRTLSALAAAGLTILTVAAATPLHAQPIDDQVQVRISDLDLSSADGAAIFDRRVRAAARQICGWMPATGLN